jgi:hypothetical protein
MCIPERLLCLVLSLHHAIHAVVHRSVGLSFLGYLERITIPLMMCAACPTDVAWKPIFVMLSTISATVMLRPANLSKSSPTTGTAPSGTGSEGLRTASWAPVGAVMVAKMAMCNRVRFGRQIRGSMCCASQRRLSSCS